MTDEQNLIIDQASNTAITIKSESKKAERIYTNVEDTKEDFRDSRDTIKTLLTDGTDAFSTLIELAKASEHPRAYEVAAVLLKNLGEMAERLITIQKSMRELEFMEEIKVNDIGANTSVTNIGNLTLNNVDRAVFTGTSTEFIEALEKEDGPVDAEFTEVKPDGQS